MMYAPGSLLLATGGQGPLQARILRSLCNRACATGLLKSCARLVLCRLLHCRRGLWCDSGVLRPMPASRAHLLVHLDHALV